MKALDLLDKFLTKLVGIGFLGIFLLNVVQILMRSMTGKSLLWVVDFSQLIFVWLMMFGATIALYRNEHLLVGFIKEKCPGKLEYVVEFLTRVLLIVFYVVIIDTGFQIAEIRMNIKYVTLGWPSGYAYMALPISGFFMILFALPSLIQTISRLVGKRDISVQYTKEIGRD